MDKPVAFGINVIYLNNIIDGIMHSEAYLSSINTVMHKMFCLKLKSIRHIS
jgi:hypothetical protein